MQKGWATMSRAFIRPAIEEALNAAGASFEILHPDSALAFRSSCSLRFCGSNDPRALHRNALLDYSAVQHPEAWKWVDEFVSGRAAFLFAHIDDESAVFSLASGASVSHVIGECPGFEFYVADKLFAFLLCENMHDDLFGAGTSKAWVAQLAPRHDAWAAALPGSDSGD
jgi:hypothetical protein